MANSNIHLVGLPSKILGHFERAQNEIDTCLNKGFTASSELLNEFSHFGNTYAINLDGEDSVVHEDIDSARIFPRKDFLTNESFFKNEIQKYTLTELEKNIVLVSKKFFDVGVLALNMIVFFLLKLDVFCEKLLTKGNVYLQTVSENTEESIQKTVSYVMPANVRRVYEDKPVLLNDVNHTITPSISCMSHELPQIIEERKNPVQSRFMYTLTVLYNELRYGEKPSMKNIDSI